MLKILHKLVFVALCVLALPHAQASEKFVVLIPGFFNFPGQDSPIGLQYFSPTIVETVRNSGFTPIVIDNLDPVGSIDENGRRLLRNLQNLAEQHPGAEFTAIGHSAGGLYLAHALTAQPDLPIKSVVTISTPYIGVELVDLLDTVPGFETLTHALNLSNLQEFRAKKMSKIWASLRVPQRVRWVALAARQPTCRILKLDCLRAQSQSLLLSMLWKHAHKDGDGVVSVDSSLGHGALLMAHEGGQKHIETWPGFILPFEHWETVLDANIFTLLGVTNPRWIDDQQRKVFSSIMEKM